MPEANLSGFRSLIWWFAKDIPVIFLDTFFSVGFMIYKPVESAPKIAQNPSPMKTK